MWVTDPVAAMRPKPSTTCYRAPSGAGNCWADATPQDCTLITTYRYPNGACKPLTLSCCALQRLLTHRVGHYYGLSTCIPEKGGHCLQLSKGINSCAPAV